jgi:hypothetical protein
MELFYAVRWKRLQQFRTKSAVYLQDVLCQGQSVCCYEAILKKQYGLNLGGRALYQSAEADSAVVMLLDMIQQPFEILLRGDHFMRIYECADYRA